MRKKNEYDFIIFDLDGTLIDTTLYIVLNYTHLFDKYAIKAPSLTDMVYFSGPPLTTVFKKYLPGIPEKDLLKDFEEFSLKYSNKYSSLYPDEIEVLEDLKKVGYKLGILTSKRRRPLEDNLKHFKLDKYFEYIIALDECPKPKPDPLGVRMLIKQAGADASRTFVIGDSSYDIEAGKRAGCRTGLVTFGLKREEVEADERFASFKEIGRRFLYEE